MIILEDLSEEDQGKIALVFRQLENQVPQANRAQVYPMILMQMQASRSKVPADEMNVFLYLTQEMGRQIEAMQAEGDAPGDVPAEDPIESAPGG